MKKFLASVLVQLIILSCLSAQYIEVSLEDRVTHSDLIIEGKVIDQYAYKKDGLIYTANKIEVCGKIFEEPLPATENVSSTYIITYGGELNGEFNTWSHMLSLSKGMEGLFFLKRNSEIEPDSLPSGATFYEVYGQEQGYIAYAKNDFWNFKGSSLFESVDDPDEYIRGINEIIEDTLITASCLRGQKSGVVLKVDTTYTNSSNFIVKTSLKGQWSREYALQKIRINIKFNTNTNLSAFSPSLSALSSVLQANYNISWTQINPKTIRLLVTKKATTSIYKMLDENFSPFLQLSFNSSLLAADFRSMQVMEATYKSGSDIISFIEQEVDNNKFIKQLFATPDITSFEPEEVCAGIKQDNSIGDPILPGYVIIHGSNFGDIDPADFSTLIPNDFRVEFRREQDQTSQSFKVTPLPEDMNIGQILK